MIYPQNCYGGGVYGGGIYGGGIYAGGSIYGGAAYGGMYAGSCNLAYQGLGQLCPPGYHCQPAGFGSGICTRAFFY